MQRQIEFAVDAGLVGVEIGPVIWLIQVRDDDAVKGFNTRLGELRHRLDDLAKPRKMAG